MNLPFQAATSHFRAKRDKAIAILDVYFNKAVDIGEQSDLMVKIVKWTESLANDCLKALHNGFGEDGLPKSLYPLTNWHYGIFAILRLP